MTSTLAGRRALVAGAAGGIGGAIVRRLLRDGAGGFLAQGDWRGPQSTMLGAS
ncbi:hypothetical protein AB0O34_07215 [Sphaerisporangium sp. NPDC088356]|uniref:hypothetical protein n=1 Tax=Sphaerisporangium sp. NPDC088356 TaxID=3154871 RepID=UPI00341FB3C0